MSKGPEPPQWATLIEALTTFVTATGGTQSHRHIKPLHWYVSCRLVIEGGFRPDDIVPHPPFRVREAKGRFVLEYDPTAALHGERTLLGGLKTT